MTSQGFNCSFCDQPATAHWHGAKVVAVCSECAVEVLPTMQADAIRILPCNAIEAAHRALDRATTVYWRALFLRMVRGEEGPW